MEAFEASFPHIACSFLSYTRHHSFLPLCAADATWPARKLRSAIGRVGPISAAPLLHPSFFSRPPPLNIANVMYSGKGHDVACRKPIKDQSLNPRQFSRLVFLLCHLRHSQAQPARPRYLDKRLAAVVFFSFGPCAHHWQAPSSPSHLGQALCCDAIILLRQKSLHSNSLHIDARVDHDAFRPGFEQCYSACPTH